MSRPTGWWPGSLVPSLLAALTSWVALWAWSGFLESPSRLLVPALMAALLVAATGAALRALRLPALVVLAGQLVAVLTWFTHRWAPELALGGWLPTPGSTRALGELLLSGVSAAQVYTAPVEDEVPQLAILLVAAGAVVALTVDFLACGLRRVPVAGLPLLAVYTAPASILLGGVPWWTFAVGAAAFLSLLAADQGRRLSQWGRRVPHTHGVADSVGDRARAGSLRASASKIGATATGLALVAPVLIPTLGNSLVLGGGPGSGGGGGDAVEINNPLVDLRRDLVRGPDVDLLEVQTNDPAPSYLRISVLDTFDGDTWEPGDREIPQDQRAEGRLPLPPGLDRTTPRQESDYEIRATEAFDSSWLPTPYPATTIDAPGDWRYDEGTLDVISAVEDQTTEGLEYTLTALEVSPTPEGLAASGPAPQSVFGQYTELPDELPQEISDLARDVTAGLGTRFEKAARLQEWFREDGGFTYTTERSAGNGTDDLVRFLRSGPDGREGYCEQFAASMAVMGRTLGIPSRVVVGFLVPDQVGEQRYVYSAHDLHAWPEMYFEGSGWLRFEPTPQGRAENVPGYTTAQVDAPDPTDGPSASTPSEQADPSARPLEDLEDTTGGGAAGSGGGPWGTAALLLAVLVALAVAPRLTRQVVRRRRWARAENPAEVAEAAWAELRDSTLDLRLPWDDSTTLRRRARELVTDFGAPGAGDFVSYDRSQSRGPIAAPEAARALERVVTDVERSRYGSVVSSAVGRPATEVAVDVATCAQALRDGTSKRRRRTAQWLPRSLVSNGWWRQALQPRPAWTGEGGAPGVDTAS